MAEELADEIALFPLNTVLFPGGPLPLRIFEARYIDLVGRCMREQTGFGVVLICEGQEAGGPAQTFDTGTYSRIVDFSQQPDGLNLARVEWLPEEIEVALPPEFADVGPALAEVLEQAGPPYSTQDWHLDSANWVAGRLAEILPLPMVHKQHCLELDDPVERLRYLRPLFEITDRVG